MCHLPTPIYKDYVRRSVSSSSLFSSSGPRMSIVNDVNSNRDMEKKDSNDDSVSHVQLAEADIEVGDLVYQKKAQLLNGAIQEVGMGKYQW